MAESDGRRSPDDGNKKEKGNVPLRQEAADSGAPGSYDDKENSQSLTQPAQSAVHTAPESRHTKPNKSSNNPKEATDSGTSEPYQENAQSMTQSDQPAGHTTSGNPHSGRNKNRNVDTVNVYTGETSKTDENQKTISSNSKKTEGGASKKFVQHKVDQIQGQDEGTMNKSDKALGRTRKRKVDSKTEVSLNKPDKTDDSQIIPSPGTDSLGSYVMVERSDVGTEEAGEENRKENQSELTAVPKTFTDDSQEHNADVSDLGNSRGADDEAETLEEEKTKYDSDREEEENLSGNQNVKPGDTYHNDLETDTESDKVENVKSQAEEGCSGMYKKHQEVQFNHESTGHEQEKQTQCLDNKINEKEGEKVRATTPQIEDLLGCSESKKNIRVDSPACEAVERSDKQPVDKSTDNELSKMFEKKCSLKESEKKSSLPVNSSEADGSSECKTVVKTPVPAPRVSLQGQDRKKDSKRGSPSPTPRQKGGTEDSVEIINEKTDVSAEDTLKPDCDDNTNKNVPGGTEDSVEIPEVADISDEDTVNQDQDGNVHNKLPESENNGHVPNVPTHPPRTNSKREQEITFNIEENEIKGQDKKEDSRRRSPSPTPRQKGGTEDSVEMKLVKADVSEKETPKPDHENNTNKNVPGGTEDSAEILKKADVSDEDTANQDQDGNVHKKLPGGTEDSVEMIRRKTDVSAEETPKPDLDDNTNKNVPEQDKKEGSKGGSPSPTSRQNGTKNNLDINLENQERGGTADSVEMIPENTDVSEEDIPKPDHDDNTNKNVPGQDKKEDSKQGSPSPTPRQKGGTEDSVERIPEKTDVSEEETPKPDHDENTNKNVPESENNGPVPTVPTRPPRTKSKREQEITVGNNENEIKGQDKKEDSKGGSFSPTSRQNGTKNNLDINLESQERETKTSLSIRVRAYEGGSTSRLYDVVLKDINDYLKWKYLIHNESASKKIKNQQLRVENGTIAVQLKNKLSGQAFEDEIRNCLSEFIKTYKGLFVACFEASGQVDTILGDLKQSKMVEKQDLYVYKISQKILFVCSDSDIELVDQEFKQALEKSKADYGGHFQIDFCCEPEQTVLFDQLDVKKFEAVKIEYTDDFRKRPYKCTVKSEKLVKLAEAKHELLCTFGKFAYGSISFANIKNINLIQAGSIPDFLSSELNVKSDFKGIFFKVCDAERRVLVAGQTQAVVDTFVQKAKKLDILRETFKDVASVKTDLLKCESEYKGRLFIEWSIDECICIGNRKLIELIVSSLRYSGGKNGEDINSNRPDDKKKRTVEIEVFETYEYIRKFIETVIDPKMFNVTVEAKQGNGKFGFIIEGSVDKNIEDCEKHIRSVKSKVKNKEISISHQAYYTETAQDLEQKYMVLLKEMKCTTVPCNSRKTKCWTFEKGRALKLSCAAARSCWKHLYVDMKMAEKGNGFSFSEGPIGDKILAKMFIPEYQASDGKQTHDFHDTVKSLLHYAKKHDCIHTCIPMDKGFGWPFTKFAKPIISAIIEFLKQSAGDLQTEVELCVENGGDFDTLNERISTALSDKEVAYETESGDGKLEIKIVEGKLDKVQTDVIVNTTARDLQLNIGSVSQSLVNKAGEELQNECVKKYPKGIKDGEIALTKGYKLDCSHVLHVALDHYGSKSKHLEQKMEEYVMDCLEITNFLGHKKVSFPALGTGSLGYPPDLVADIMLKSIRNYEKKLGDANVIQEVEIVLQSPDLCSMFKAKKNLHEQRGKFSSPVTGESSASISKHITCSGVIVDAQCISLDDCRKADALLVFWDKSILMSASKKTKILQDMGDDAARRFFAIRDNNKKDRKDQRAFDTIGGKLKNRIVYHIPVTHQQEFLQSLREGIEKADIEESYSIAVILGRNGPFHLHEEKVKNIVEVVKSVADDLVNLRHVSLVVDSEKSHQYFKIFEEEYQKQGAVNTTYCIDMKIIGYEEAILKAEEELKQHSLPLKTQIHNIQEDSAKAPEVFLAPSKETFDDAVDRNSSGQCQGEVKKEDVLMKSLEGYVMILNVPKNYTYKDLSGALFSCNLSIPMKKLIYLSGMSEAVLVCNSSEDVLKLCGYKGALPFAFTSMEKQVLGHLTMKIQKADLDKLRDEEKFSSFLEHLRKLDVILKEKDDSIVKVETTYQMKCLRFLLQRLLNDSTETYGTSKVITSEDNEFVHVHLRTREIENVKDQLWQIMQIEKKSKLDEFRKLGGMIKHTGNKLELRYGGQQTDGDMFDDYFNVFNTFVKDMISMEFEEISAGDCSIESIFTWQREIENSLKRKCCTYIPEEKKIIGYCDTYENVKKVEHHFLVKQGKRKQTGRRRKAIAADEYGPTHLEPEHATSLAERKTDFQWGRDARNIQCFKTIEGVQVYVYQADILNLDVDCIVNAANDSLSHGGGVALVIARKAGQQLTEEGDFYIKKHGYIPVGDAVSTTAGNLPYKKVIHAVGPRWSDYTKDDKGVDKCEQDLFNAIFNSCQRAKEMKYQSIAFPAVSSAIFCVPEDLCVCQYVKATIEFSKINKDSLKEIHFIDKNPDIVRKIQSEFKTVLEDGKETPYNRQAHVSQSRFGRRRAFGHTSSNVVEGNTYSDHKQDQTQCSEYQEHLRKSFFANSKKRAEKDAVIYSLDGDENHQLRICKGDLLQVDSAAIVVTLNENKRGGTLARAVETKMTEACICNTYRKEVQKLLPGKAEVGQIVITKGYGTQFSNIIHVVLPLSERNKNQVDRRQSLFEIYKKVLLGAMENQSIKIVATALIGVGDTTDEVDLGFNVFLDGYLWFLEKLKSEKKSGPDVHLVCRDEKHFKRICSTFNCFVEQSLTSHAGGFQSSVKEVMPEPEKQDQGCVICMDEMTVPKTLKCGHSFCTDCIDKYFEIKRTCPTCGAICGVITGDQPEGRMDIYTNRYSHCAGYQDVGQIVITYAFASGKQGTNHPSPGTWYEGITRRAYLPDNKEGQTICKMLKVAFERKLVFTIGRSRTTGKEGVITWNDIHHKTDPRPHTQFGYPDETYLSRVKDELAAKGVTEDDIK